jgi:septal ring factor EnvC (AmiA/AmiB activator)
MSSKERFLYFAIIFFSVYYLVNMYSSNEEEYITEYNSKIEALNDKINSLHDVNENLTLEIDVLTTQISVLDQEISKQDSKIVILKKQTNEKVNNVDSYRDDELEQFFTERYRQYLDSIKKTNSSISN